jgi:DNA-binding MarR family transcriptional regulator
MADIIPHPKSQSLASDEDIITLIELLFFAYRDFVSDPDLILSRKGFGRAHHRVLHFVGRNPGLTVARLLDILRITKQSLARVLKDLLRKGYVRQQAGPEDRRQRLLYLTAEGEALHKSLMAPQIARIRRALAETGRDAPHHARGLLFHLISPENRATVRDLIDAEMLLGRP